MQITIENISFRYPGDADNTLHEISCTIGPGERVAIVGHNGSGKTTLVKHFNGLLIPQQGRVRLGSRVIEGRHIAWCASRVALAFQNPDDQIYNRRIYDEVAFGPKNLGHTGIHLDNLVRESLALFGLADRFESNPYDLGYSQRKRLAMASIVAMDTPALVFDEPTAGLDDRESRQFQDVLRVLQEKGKTVVIISHDMDFVAEQIPRAVCLDHGRIIYDGQVDTLFSEKRLLVSCGLQQPQIFRLSCLLALNPAALTLEKLITGVIRQGQPVERTEQLCLPR